MRYANDCIVEDHIPDIAYEALNVLDRAEKAMNRIGMEFPDISSFDFNMVKGVFKKLPTTVSKGVQSMGLHIGEDYRSLLTEYEKNSYILPHFHSNEIEIIEVLEGEVKDEVTCTIYEKGDIIIIPKSKLHHIVTENKEAYLYIVFSEDKKLLAETFPKLKNRL